MSTTEIIREQAEQELERGQVAAARALLRELWRRQPTTATAGFVLNCHSHAGEKDWAAVPCRVALLRSFTVEPLLPLLKAGALLEGLDLTVHTGAFNAYAQELLDPSSSLYAFEPRVVILAIQTRDLLPELWEDFGRLSEDETTHVVAQTLEQFECWLAAFRRSSTAHMVVHNFEHPPQPGSGILDEQTAPGQSACITELNEGLRRVARKFENVSILDYDGLVSRIGRDRWFDPLKWSTARFPIAPSCLIHLPKEWLRFLYAVAGPLRKVLVTDLDNTLWGGLAGEEGLEGVRLGPAYPDCGYRHLQAAMLDLYRRGVLLAINSKNNETDARRILEGHSGMLLRPEHFAAMRINWQDKAQNLREIAAELNLGTDSLVFLDDNPVERQRIRMELPEVEVIDLPTDPMLYEAALRDCVFFERLAITDEDRARQQHYQQQRGRVELQRAAASLEEFYWSLRQTVVLSPMQPASLGRVAQLTRKTNQFNVTTKRYSEQELHALAARPDWQIWTVEVSDRFGDNGLVGVAITHSENSVCEIDTLLLSCRVIGRTVETAILAHLLAQAQQQGMRQVLGVFLPTKKNAPAAGLFRDHGFTRQDDRWIFDLTQPLPACPAWIDAHVTTELVAHAAH